MATHSSLPSALWDRPPREVQDSILARAARVATLEAPVQDLMERVPQDSRTAARPPSSDPRARQRPRRRPRGRRPGGQPGHPGPTRRMLPGEDVDEGMPLQPAPCARCQQPLWGEAPPPPRQQVCERPPRKPVVTEAPGHQLVCPACGDTTRAAGPDGVTPRADGPHVHAITALGTGAERLSKRTTQHRLADCFGVTMRLGTGRTLEAATVAAVAVSLEEARALVKQHAGVAVDETGGRQGPPRAWLWGAVTPWVTGFVVRLSRGGEVARDLWGAAGEGLLGTDRWSASHGDPVRWRQLCGAHLVRDIEAMIGRGGSAQASGDARRGHVPHMLHGWHCLREGTRQRSRCRPSMTSVRREVKRLLAAGSPCGVPQTAGVCRDVLTRRPALWTFVHRAGVDPTNNAAERARRPGVRWRKGSFGTQSAPGARCVEALMTMVPTWKQHHRNPLASLTTAFEATLRGEAAPALLPADDVG